MKFMTFFKKNFDFDEDSSRTELLFLTLFVLSIFSLILIASHALAQDPGFDHTAKFEDRWRKEGQLVTVLITKARPMRIFVLGREEAKIDFAKFKITVRRAQPYPGKILKLNRFDNYYEVDDSNSLKQVTDLEVTAQLNDKNETFHFDLHHEANEK
jgi:hypothetical protein